MKQKITIEENELHLVLGIGEDEGVYLLHLGPEPFGEETIQPYQVEKFRMVQLQTVGSDHPEHHGSKHCGTMPGASLRYVKYEDMANRFGRKLVVYQEAEGICVRTHIQFYEGVPAVRFWNEVENPGDEPFVLEYVSSLALAGCAKEGRLPWDEKMQLYIPHNTWAGECQWRVHSLRELGLCRVEGSCPVSDPQSMQNFSMKRICLTSEGTWGCSEYLPMGAMENKENGNCFMWQIESHNTWHCEISDNLGQLYLQLSGPTGSEHQWYKEVKPGESFQTVKVCVAVGKGFDRTVGALTAYRRLIRRPNEDNVKLPVIFNDYMNCLYGDPTTEKLIPLIDVAAEAGCEYFCIDAGWYADGGWWDEVGEWMPSDRRFPGGIKEPLNYIKEKGMVPGLWLELEVMGVNCPLAAKLPDDWFFMRFGKRVKDHGRYQLDYRNPEVRRYADGIIQRLVEDYGVGYIKMDYNINAGPGTDNGAFSAGDGLLEHGRAYLKWLEQIFIRYPDLVIENCSSGGMRMAYSLLSLCSVQSTSDQIDYKKTAVIAAAAATAVTPEQAAVWSYPTSEGDEEETICNMVNALLGRIHQSGHLAAISSERFALVREAIGLYKKIREDIREGIPFWPLGLPVFEDEWIACGLKIPKQNRVYLAVWHLKPGKNSRVIEIEALKEQKSQAECIYPCKALCEYEWDWRKGSLSITFPDTVSARLFCIEAN